MGLLDLWNKPEKNVKDIIQNAILNNEAIAIKYRNFDGEISSRTLSKIRFNTDFENEGETKTHIKGFCSMRKEDRTFKIDRIMSVDVIK